MGVLYRDHVEEGKVAPLQGVTSGHREYKVLTAGAVGGKEDMCELISVHYRFLRLLRWR
jgi:hypothetical protein